MRRTTVCLLLAALLLMTIVATALAATTITGKVVFRCPKGNALKVQTSSATVMMYVNPNCANAAQLRATIKALQVGNCVRACYQTVNGTNYVINVVKL